MPKACDACQSSNAVVYCRADAAYLCVSCDGKVHGANKLASRHERVWMCEVCELAPAVVTCKADAAALCISCDTDIHSANPLARRHERVQITPFFECPTLIKAGQVDTPNSVVGESQFGYGCGTGKQQQRLGSAGTKSGGGMAKNGGGGGAVVGAGGFSLEKQQQRPLSALTRDQLDDAATAEAASWLLPPPKGAGLKDSPEQSVPDVQPPLTKQLLKDKILPKSVLKLEPEQDLFSEDVDPYLDLEYASAMAHVGGADSSHVVPVHVAADLGGVSSPSLSDGSGSFEHDVPGKYGYSHNTSLSHSMSSSSMDTGVVPDPGISDAMSFESGHAPHPHPNSGMFEFPPRVLHVGSVLPMAREARVLRYKEKRKNRKFEKTIRYASRKAYAESRPRVKGRFAKRTGSDATTVPEAVPDVVQFQHHHHHHQHPSSHFQQPPLHYQQQHPQQRPMYSMMPDPAFGVVPSF